MGDRSLHELAMLTSNDELSAVALEVNDQLDAIRDELTLLTGHHDRLEVETGAALDAITKRLDDIDSIDAIARRALVARVAALERQQQQPAPDTIAVPVAKLRAWQIMVRDIAWEIEMTDKADLRWIYNVGQAYADANVVAGEITDVLREVGDEP